MKKITIILIFLIIIPLMSGCSHQAEMLIEDDPISEYDSIEDIQVEGINGKFVVKSKILPYKDGKVAVLHINNQTGEDCSLEITGTYKDNDGKIISTESKSFFGLSKGDSNYFFFQSTTSFDQFSYSLKLLDNKGEAYSGYYRFSTSAWGEALGNSLGGNLPIPEEEYYKAIIKSKMSCTSPESLAIRVVVLTFDNNGDVADITPYSGNNMNGELHIPIANGCSKENGTYILNDNLTGTLRRIVSIEKIYTSEEWNKELIGD